MTHPRYGTAAYGNGLGSIPKNIGARSPPSFTARASRSDSCCSEPGLDGAVHASGHLADAFAQRRCARLVGWQTGVDRQVVHDTPVPVRVSQVLSTQSLCTVGVLAAPVLGVERVQSPGCANSGN